MFNKKSSYWKLAVAVLVLAVLVIFVLLGSCVGILSTAAL